MLDIYQQAFAENGKDGRQLRWRIEHVDPIANYYAAVTRALADGRACYPDQKMGRTEALRSFTINSAYATFEDDVKGTLAVGKLADGAVLTKDITAVPDDEIKQARVAYTIVGGQVAYRAPGQPSAP